MPYSTSMQSIQREVSLRLPAIALESRRQDFHCLCPVSILSRATPHLPVAEASNWQRKQPACLSGRFRCHHALPFPPRPRQRPGCWGGGPLCLILNNNQVLSPTQWTQACLLACLLHSSPTSVSFVTPASCLFHCHPRHRLRCAGYKYPLSVLLGLPHHLTNTKHTAPHPATSRHRRKELGEMWPPFREGEHTQIHTARTGW